MSKCVTRIIREMKSSNQLIICKDSWKYKSWLFTSSVAVKEAKFVQSLDKYVSCSSTGTLRFYSEYKILKKKVLIENIDNIKDLVAMNNYDELLFRYSISKHKSRWNFNVVRLIRLYWNYKQFQKKPINIISYH